MLAQRSSRAATCQQQQRHAAVRSMALSSRVALSSWESSSARHHQGIHLEQQAVQRGKHRSDGPRRAVTTMMGNKSTGGPFSPLVTVVRNIVGEKDFNKLRGKAISLHSQIIKDFCKQLGVENKQVQGVIRLAKKNGEWLGFLA
eukprot:CAMPEP_0119106602 /NCGR_PEP_ID=MMETSP1180-20130426/5192_1 /TAXON_ID=3052 ORGANISM="Chlamydomonas cf sp, Strain CCMP681" /NCGR_SAMPLE_ID=MMETSP1180 /ASSEMBLY_ACC=CAM_ASM_000741 /LENGTH=143 /DNA_ID=CAMNT_0007091967 /DNA_START=87 /DNA_END=518 /DNA_ORIENTATION=+